ncbi:MAG: UDP-N-acetylmuramoyl-L-alanyl-D-glutamate--2,6-diaminopimelate ligase [Bacteroidota bacterium]|jgi:UDP-N-acetylmuramoyl-L-alanyl-D-glutamate--2,6-diaminopimelate ligase|nr:UDP-N-acetylmuramoyl-L-alanyl-D-glutamate--2,6-diaminopimelate ligase [Bacteroidota bacterium]
MAALKDILYKVSLVSVSGDMNLEVSHICLDSRQVREGSLFIAVAGTQVDGHDYIQKAIEQGAVGIVCEVMPDYFLPEVTYVRVENSARSLGIIASNFWGNPSSKLTMVGVTGTNGKTTTVSLLFSLFRKLGYNTGLISTVNNKINEKVIPATHTTPDAIKLNELLSQMVQEGCTHCFMEVSSHAIVQERVRGISYKVAVFTNITHDHLDYHLTFDAYITAKKQLFDELPAGSYALVNIDDKRGQVMVQNTKAFKKTYSLKSGSDFKAKVINNTMQGLELEIDNKNIWFKLIGDFNAYNLLAVFGVASLLEEDPVEVLTHLSDIQPAKGRFEQFISANGIMGIVDYAHTPDALENVLETIQSLRTGNEQVITVVGCGGNRDKDKRPIMAEIACKHSSLVIMTSDNPRFEEPEAILKEMEAGVSPSNFKKTEVIIDRREAIKKACIIANPKDIILVAGKGHENYQEVKGVKYDFDDKKILMEILNSLHK